MLPISVAAPSKVWVYGSWFPETAGSNSVGGMDDSLATVVCCHVEGNVMGRSLVQRIPTECGVSACDRGSSLTEGTERCITCVNPITSFTTI